MYYAQINEEKICIGISELNILEENGEGANEIGDLIKIDNYSQDYIYRKYENNVWSEEKFIPNEILKDSTSVIEQKIRELAKKIETNEDILAEMATKVYE